MNRVSCSMNNCTLIMITIVLRKKVYLPLGLFQTVMECPNPLHQ